MTLCCLFALVSVTLKPMEVVVTEREKGFRQQLAIAGCRPGVYVAASVCVNGAVMLVPLAVVMALLGAFRMVGAGAAALLLLPAVLFCFAGAAFNYCLSLRFRKGTTATTVVSIVLTWLVSVPLLLSVLISVLLLASDVLLGAGAAFVLRALQFLLELVPPFAFLNAVVNTMVLPPGYPLATLLAWKSRYALDVLALALDLAVYFAVALAQEYKADAVPAPAPVLGTTRSAKMRSASSHAVLFAISHAARSSGSAARAMFRRYVSSAAACARCVIVCTTRSPINSKFSSLITGSSPSM